jgi:ParB-like chromosome segregation protein Spo0J
MEIREIALNEIVANPDFMMRDGIDKALVAQYKDNLADILQASPIEVYETPDGFYLVDGFHRRAAARQLEQTTIRAIVKRGSVADAYAAACLANLRHGKPLGRSERKKAIQEYIKLKVKYSNVRIATEVGVSDVTILRYRTELEADGEIEPQEKRIGADSRTTSLTSTNVEVKTVAKPDPFDNWLAEHVTCGDALKILPTLNRQFDLIIVDPPYGITTEEWDLTNKHDLLTLVESSFATA